LHNHVFTFLDLSRRWRFKARLDLGEHKSKLHLKLTKVFEIATKGKLELQAALVLELAYVDLDLARGSFLRAHNLAEVFLLGLER
jgi:hypothetical protein